MISKNNNLGSRVRRTRQCLPPCVVLLLGCSILADPLDLKRDPLPEERNAYSLWSKALPALELPRDSAFRDSFRQIANLSSNLPPAEVVAEVRTWLQSKEEPLALLSQGIARGEVRLGRDRSVLPR